MSKSSKLSKTIYKNKISSEKSASQEDLVKRATHIVVKRIKCKYPKLHFEWEQKLHGVDIMYQNSQLHPDLGQEISNPNSFIKPDGGFFYLIDKNGKSRLILSSEMKKQGTNDKRATKKLKKQSMGNAVERFAKNPNVIKTIVEYEDIFPYVMFVSGCDFFKGSSIRDRLSSANRNAKFNIIHCLKKRLKNGNLEPIMSIFVKTEQWTLRQISNVLYKMASKSIKHYLKNS